MAGGANTFPGFPVQASVGGVEPASTSQPSGLDQIRYSQFSPPDLQSFNASPRRRLFVAGGSVAVPLSSSNTALAVIQIPDLLGRGDGLFVEAMAALVTPQDTAGKLTIVDTALQIANANNPYLPIGTPEATTLVPRVNTSLIFSPIPLLAAPDLDEWSRLVTNTTLFGVNGQPVRFQLSVSMANSDNAAAHSFFASLWLTYRFINGLTGA